MWFGEMSAPPWCQSLAELVANKNPTLEMEERVYFAVNIKVESILLMYGTLLCMPILEFGDSCMFMFGGKALVSCRTC